MLLLIWYLDSFICTEYRARILTDVLQQWGLHNQTRSKRRHIFHNKQRTSSGDDKAARYPRGKVHQDIEQGRFLW